MRSFACEKKIFESYCANVDASFEIGKKYSFVVGMFVGLVSFSNETSINFLDGSVFPGRHLPRDLVWRNRSSLRVVDSWIFVVVLALHDYFGVVGCVVVEYFRRFYVRRWSF